MANFFIGHIIETKVDFVCSKRTNLMNFYFGAGFLKSRLSFFFYQSIIFHPVGKPLRPVLQRYKF
jgi:hypothetical protein